MSHHISVKLDQVQQTVQDLLKSFAENGGFSPDTLAPAFGTDINTEELRRLEQRFVQGDFSSLPEIEIRDRAELGGARGAYALETDKIYLARGFIEQATSPDIVKVLLEEIGHGVDARINTTDSPGDEGDIFSRLVRGEELSAAQQEDDTVELVIDGETLTGEASILRVDTLTDVVDSDDGVTSLREALESAVSGDIITFASGLSGGTITLGGSELAVTKSLTIDGDLDNDGVGDITIDGNGQSRVLLVDDENNDSSRNVFLDGLTVTGGTTSSNGGGIHNRESLTITNSTISGNSARDNGGGIDNNHGGTMTITNSTISGNSASFGGGIQNFQILTITNSTVSGNSVKYDGGGINNAIGTLTITNSTISGNSASYSGGGISNKFYSTTILESTIVADNTAVTNTPDIFNDEYGNTVTARNSLLENGTITKDLGNNITGEDPLLDPNGLQDNGGSVQTIALLPGSVAINAGSNPDSLTTDQRGEGFARTSGGRTDIGAYEVEPPEEAAYSFEGSGTTVEDISPNNHTLTLVNGASRTSISTKRSGTQLNLDGTDDYGEIPTLETGAGFTFAAFVNYDSFDNWSRVFDFGDGAANNNILLTNFPNNGNAVLEVYGSNGVSGGKLNVTNFWSVNTSVHVTATISETGVLSLYKNGELAGTLQSTVIPTTKVRSHNYIGRSAWSTDDYFDGLW